MIQPDSEVKSDSQNSPVKIPVNYVTVLMTELHSLRKDIIGETDLNSLVNYLTNKQANKTNIWKWKDQYSDFLQYMIFKIKFLRKNYEACTIKQKQKQENVTIHSKMLSTT